jgi:hypothetical protein
MRKQTVLATLLILAFAVFPAAKAGAMEPMPDDMGFGPSLQDLNRAAAAGLEAFALHLAGSFGLPVEPVNRILIEKRFPPSDVYVLVKIAQITGRPLSAVTESYWQNRGKGWGALAKSLGIKPGSPEFHRLKKDEYGTLSGAWKTGGKKEVAGAGKGKGNGKENNADKGKGKNK